MAESFVRSARKIYRQEDYARNPIGKVAAVNANGTYAVLLQNGLTVDLTNGTSEKLYVGSIVSLTRRSRNGAFDIAGLSARKWKEPTIIFG